MKFQAIFVVLIVTLFVITTEAHRRKHYKDHKHKHGLSRLPCEMRNCTAKGKSCVELRPLCLHNNTAITRSKCVGTPPKGCEKCICVREDGKFSCRKDISELQIPVCKPKRQHNKNSHKKCRCRDDDKNDDYDKKDDDYDHYNYDGDLGSGDGTKKKIRSKGHKCHKPDPKSSPKHKHGLSRLPCEMRNCTAKGKSCVELRPLCLHNNTAITRSKCVGTPPKGCEKCICVREDGEFSCRKDISEIQIPVCIQPSPKPRHNKKCRCRDDDNDDKNNDDDYESYNFNEYESYNYDDYEYDDYESYIYDEDLGSGNDTNNGKKIKPTRSKGHKPCHHKPDPKSKHRPRMSPKPTLKPKSDPKPSTNIKPTPRPKNPKPTPKPKDPTPKPRKDPKTKPKKKP